MNERVVAVTILSELPPRRPRWERCLKLHPEFRDVRFVGEMCILQLIKQSHCLKRGFVFKFTFKYHCVHDLPTNLPNKPPEKVNVMKDTRAL